MDDNSQNPRAVIGSNVPDAIDYAKVEVERLERDYAEMAATAENLVAEAETVPDEIADDEEKGAVASLIKRIRDAAKRIEGFRELEKQPYFRRAQGIDQFFFRLTDRLLKRNRRDRDGAADRLQAILTAYDTKKLREEQERRRLIAEAAEREAAAARKKATEEAAAAEAKRLAAERARKEETKATKGEQAAVSEAAASAAATEAAITSQKAEAAYIDTLAKPAEIMRNRGADGTLSTMATEPYAEVENDLLLDKEKLWPFIKLEAKEAALRSWARTTSHNQQMLGAKIGKRPKSVVR